MAQQRGPCRDSDGSDGVAATRLLGLYDDYFSSNWGYPSLFGHGVHRIDNVGFGLSRQDDSNGSRFHSDVCGADGRTTTRPREIDHVQPMPNIQAPS